MAFPWLFPTGEGSYEDVGPVHVSFKDYLEHWAKWHDHRFARDALFVFFATNTLQRQQACKAVGVVGARTENQYISVGELRRAQAVAAGQTSPEADVEANRLLQRLVPFFNEVKDSAPFWKARRKEVIDPAIWMLCVCMTFFLGSNWAWHQQTTLDWQDICCKMAHG